MNKTQKKILKDLSTREKDVLEAFWAAGKPLIASELNTYNNSLTKGTVQAVIKSLIKKDLLKVDEIVYSGTVLARSYVPTISASEYAKEKVCDDINAFAKFVPKSRIIAELLDSDDIQEELFEELEEMIRIRRNSKKEES